MWTMRYICAARGMLTRDALERQWAITCAALIWSTCPQGPQHPTTPARLRQRLCRRGRDCRVTTVPPQQLSLREPERTCRGPACRNIAFIAGQDLRHFLLFGRD